MNDRHSTAKSRIDEAGRPRAFITTAIPYVNGDAHVGHALELIEADVLARWRRVTGWNVRLQSGTDDHAAKNAAAAERAGREVSEWVAEKAGRFRALAQACGVELDDFVSTSSDERHRPTVERLWAESAGRGDFYQAEWHGQYCDGCEAFLDDQDLERGVCPEHRRAPHPVIETNWFFRLSKYQTLLEQVLTDGTVVIEPPERAAEALGIVRRGLSDCSVSRPVERTGGWGIPVPCDPSQCVYVWWDALANYLSGLDCGRGGDAFAHWWNEDSERVHVIGKGILRFHAIIWVALLASAGVLAPTRILVHDYLTVDGNKIAKTTGPGPDPIEVIATIGQDALRWFCCAEVSATKTSDFTLDRAVEAYHRDLAHGVGNLAARWRVLHGRRDGRENDTLDPELEELAGGLAAQVDVALEAFDLREACRAINDVVAAGNRALEHAAPWLAYRDGDQEARARADQVVDTIGLLLDRVSDQLAIFLPDGGSRLADYLEGTRAGCERQPVFGRLELDGEAVGV